MGEYYIKICDEKDVDEIEYVCLSNHLLDGLSPIIVDKREEATIFDSKDMANIYKDNVNILLATLNSTRRATVVALEVDSVSERLTVTVPQRWDGTSPVEIQNLKLGDNISIIDILWRVVHYVDDDDKIYLTLCSEDVLGIVPYSVMVWADRGTLQLDYNYCRKLCDDLEHQLDQHLTDYAISAKEMVSLDIDDETGHKCHLLALKQLNGELNWFKPENRRVAGYLNKPMPYWTDTLYGSSGSYVWFVDAGGTFCYTELRNTLGFRPCIHLSFNKYCK